jgi:hypothetical protein
LIGGYHRDGLRRGKRPSSGFDDLAVASVPRSPLVVWLRFTTAPFWSSPTRLQLFFPRSIPRTAICIGLPFLFDHSGQPILPEEEGQAIP